MRSFRVATDRVTGTVAKTPKAPVPLREVFEVSAHRHRSLVAPHPAALDLPHALIEWGHDAHRHPRG